MNTYRRVVHQRIGVKHQQLGGSIAAWRTGPVRCGRFCVAGLGFMRFTSPICWPPMLGGRGYADAVVGGGLQNSQGSVGHRFGGDFAFVPGAVAGLHWGICREFGDRRRPTTSSAEALNSAAASGVAAQLHTAAGFDAPAPGVTPCRYQVAPAAVDDQGVGRDPIPNFLRTCR